MNSKYVPAHLSLSDKQKQINQINKSKKDYQKGKFTRRERVGSFQGKTSNFVEMVKKKTGLPMNFDLLSSKLTRTQKRKQEVQQGFEEIYKKGRGAYYSSGSRPNQTPESWGKARVASVLVGGPSRKIDENIVKKYKVPLI